MVTRKVLKVDKNTDDLLMQCKEEYLQHHPEMRKIPLSRNKIIYEISKYYLNS